MPCMTASQEWLKMAENLHPFTPQGELAGLQFSFLNRKAEVMIAEISLRENAPNGGSNPSIF